jgi:uncharacterized membrane protein
MGEHGMAVGTRVEPVAATRLQSLDVMRGVVMVLMAVDHVRVYSGVPAGGPSPGVFFTRWVTHFCAPAFVFFAGTSAFLHGRSWRPAVAGPQVRLKADSTLDLQQSRERYLLTRGLLLVLLELTVIRVAWTFNLDFANYILAGVIWMIGWCLILLALMVRLPIGVVATIGAVIVAGHNLVDSPLQQLIPAAQASRLFWLWRVLYFGPTAGGEGPFVVLYSLIPWIGVIALGYAFGAVMMLEPARRRRICAWLGLAATAAFVALRAARLYGEPRPWNGASALGFLNTTKYPASLQFLLMTLGPTIALLPLAERARGTLTNALAVFGRVPLFYYLLHIPVIHAAALVVSVVREGRVNPWLFENHPMMSPPPPSGYVWSLPLLYLVFAIVIALLFLPCRWYANVRLRHRHAWMRYL